MLVRGEGLIICEQGLTPQLVQASRHPGTHFDVVSIK